MKLNILLAVAAFSLGADAFYNYLTPAHKGAQRKIHVSDQISKGFSFQGAEVPLNDGAGLAKFPLRKRSHPKLAKRSNRKAALTKRDNDFKYETDNTPSAPDSAAMDQDGTDTSYFAEVTVGTDPGEKLLLLMDTGSSAMWVMGQDCTSAACQIHNLYGSGSSSSMKDAGGNFDISYQSGSVTGGMVTDKVNFAGMDIDMTFGVASQTSDDFKTYAMDGIMGLARSASGTDFDATPFIEVIKQAKALKANIFGVWLDRASDGDKNGEINFGAPDTSRYSGNLNYIATTSEDQRWQIPMDDAQMNGDSLSFSGKQAVVDTGTSLMFVPPDDAAAIFKGVDGATLPDGEDIYQIPCDTTAELSLVFNSVSYTISPKDFVGGTVSGSSDTCYAHVIAIAAVDDDPNTWLLGDTFLKNVYTVFDADQNRVGFGTPSSDADSSSSSSSSSTPSSSDSSSGASATSDSQQSGSQTSAVMEAAATGTESPEALLPNAAVSGSSTGSGSGSSSPAATGSSSSGSEGSDAMGSIGNQGSDAPPGPRGASAFGLAIAVGVMCFL